MSIAGSRIDAIDFVKGALVLAMVVYHAMNYAGYDSLPRDYMGFLPTSFIMITGFLVMQVYAGQQSRDARTIAHRLAVRGLKLIAIFTALNLAARLVWHQNHYGVELSVAEFLGNWFRVYVTADAPGVAFDVLVPIAYTIFLAIGVLAVRRMVAVAPLVLAVTVFGVCLWLDVESRPINNLNFISAGLIGLWIGDRSLDSIDRAVTSRAIVMTLGLFYAAVLWTGSKSYAAQIGATFVVLALLFAIGRRLSSTTWSVRQCCLLGRYSLLSYIVQILFLQASGAIDSIIVADQMIRTTILIIWVSFMMWVAVAIVDVGRQRLPTIDKAYRAIFS